MDVVQDHGVDVKSSIRVSGVTSADSNGDIIAFFAKYGTASTESQGGEIHIVEFESETAMANIESDLPLEIVYNRNVQWQAAHIKLPEQPQTSSLDPALTDSSDDADNDSGSNHSTTPLIRRSKQKYNVSQPPFSAICPASQLPDPQCG